MVFSKKGFFYRNISSGDYSNLILFTENKLLSKIANLKNNVNSFFLKFPKKNIDKFLYKNISDKKKFIFSNNDKALLINVSFPRKNSRANTFTVLSKKDF